VPKADYQELRALEDLKGEFFWSGAQVGTAFVDALKKTGLFAEVKAYDTIAGHPARCEHGSSQGRSAIIRSLPTPQARRISEVRLVDSYKPTIVARLLSRAQGRCGSAQEDNASAGQT